VLPVLPVLPVLHRERQVEAGPLQCLLALPRRVLERVAAHRQAVLGGGERALQQGVQQFLAGLAGLRHRPALWARARAQAAAPTARPMARPARSPSFGSSAAARPSALRMREVPDTADRILLDIVERHTFLTADDLAAVLGWLPRQVVRQRNDLLGSGLLRLLDPKEVSAQYAEEVAAGLLELTPAGLALVAAQQGLIVAAAVRLNGFVGGGPAHRPGSCLSRTRYVLLRHLAHTRGTDRFFVALARSAGRTGHTTPGTSDAALVLWRNAVACARRRVRPDGYGVLRLDGRRHGFFLEYDRETQDAAAYRRKLAAYYSYRDTGHYALDYTDFLELLLVGHAANE
jgi:hypothetical protein